MDALKIAQHVDLRNVARHFHLLDEVLLIVFHVAGVQKIDTVARRNVEAMGKVERVVSRCAQLYSVPLAVLFS